MTNGRSGTGTVGASRRSASGWLSLVMATAVVAVGCSGEETVRPFLGSPEPEEDEETGKLVRSALLAADVDARLGGNESHTAINPLDTQVIAVSLCFTISLSFDGGRTFNAADQVALQLPPGYGGAGCDDVVTFDAQGRLFVTFLSQIPCTGPSPFCTRRSRRHRAVRAAGRRPSPRDRSGVAAAGRGRQQLHRRGGEHRPVPVERHASGGPRCLQRRLGRQRPVGGSPVAGSRRAARLRHADAGARDAHLQSIFE